MKNKILFFFPLFLFFLGCSNDNETSNQEETVKEVSSEVLLFEFTNDIQNNSYQLHYEIKYTNPNDFAIKGTPSVTMDYNGLILTPFKIFPTESFPYIEIGANSSYTEVYNVKTPHNTQLLSPEQINTYYIKFVSTKFIVLRD